MPPLVLHIHCDDAQTGTTWILNRTPVISAQEHYTRASVWCGPTFRATIEIHKREHPGRPITCLSQAMSTEETSSRFVPVPDIEMQMFAPIVSGITYGPIFLLSLPCFQLIYQKLIYQKLRPLSETTSKRMNRILLLYILFIAGLDTLIFLGEIISVRTNIFAPPADSPGVALAEIPLFISPLASSSADGFMVRSRSFSSQWNFVNKLFRLI